MQLTKQQRPCSRSFLRLNLMSFLVLLASTNATVSYASTHEAWEEFRKDVEKTCKAATSDLIENPKVILDPFGSASFGLAIVRGKSTYNKHKLEIICVYDKKSKAVEISGELKTP